MPPIVIRPADAAVIAHNASGTAHPEFSQAGGRITTAVSDHNAAVAPHPNKFEAAGAVNTHNTAVAPHPNTFEPSGAVNTHNTAVAPHPDKFEPSGAVSTHDSALAPHAGKFEAPGAVSTHNARIPSGVDESGADLVHAPLWGWQNVLAKICYHSGLAAQPGVQEWAGSSGVFTPFFAGGGSEFLHWSLELPHGYIPGRTIIPYIKWSLGASQVDQVNKWVRMFMKTMFRNSGDGTLTMAETLVHLAQVSGPDYGEIVTEGDPLLGTHLLPSGTLIGYLNRDNGIANNAAGPAQIFAFGFHVPVMRAGTPNRLSPFDPVA